MILTISLVYRIPIQSVQKRGFKETSANKAVDCEADGMGAQAPAMRCLLFGQHIRTLLVMGTGRGKLQTNAVKTLPLGGHTLFAAVNCWRSFPCGKDVPPVNLW